MTESLENARVLQFAPDQAGNAVGAVGRGVVPLKRTESTGSGRHPGRREKTPPVFAARDLLVAAKIAALLPVSWFRPMAAWAGAAERRGERAAARDPGRTTILSAIERLIEGHQLPCSAGELLRGHHALHVLQFLQFLREWRPGGWHPSIRVEGLDHLERARDQGRGAVLWVAPFVSSNLVTKKALAAHGFALVHLGSRTHGPTWSEVGRVLVNPFEVAAESRYIRRRITWSEASHVPAVRSVRDELARGALVSIAMGSDASQLERLPFLNGRIPVPTGPAALSLATEAPLLPVFTHREGLEGFRVEVAAPLVAPHGARRREAVSVLLAGARDALAARVRLSPLDYRDWLELSRSMESP